MTDNGKPSARMMHRSAEDPFPATWQPGGFIPHLLAALVLAVVAGLLLAQSWDRWGDLLIDLGRDLYLPGEILKGRVLYRQLLYNYGPVTPYLLAGLVALFGDKLSVFVSVGLLSGLATAAGLYTLGWLAGGFVAACASAFLFIALNFSVNNTWGCTFVLPYAYSAVLATAFAVWSVVFLFRHLYLGGRKSDWILGNILLLLAVFTKQDVALAVCATHLAAWWAHRVPLKGILKVLLAGTGLGIVTVVLFAARSPADHSLVQENLFRFGGGSSVQSYFLEFSTIDWKWSLLVVLAALGGPILFWFSLTFLGGWWKRFRETRGGWAWAVAGMLALVPIDASDTLRRSLGDVRILGLTPYLALAVVAFLLLRRSRDPLLLLGIFVIFSAIRIPLTYYPYWYGFYLTVPAYPFLACWLVSRLPRVMPSPRLTVAWLIMVCALMVARFEHETWKGYHAMTSILVTAKGTLGDYPVGRVEAIAQFLEHVSGNEAPRHGMVVLPEGVTLNYFTGIPNPTPYCLFLPPELASPPGTEDRMVRELAAAKPELVVLVSRDMGEFGTGAFGVDYGLKIRQWVEANYRLERIFAKTDDAAFKLVLLARADR